MTIISVCKGKTHIGLTDLYIMDLEKNHDGCRFINCHITLDNEKTLRSRNFYEGGYFGRPNTHRLQKLVLED